MPWVYLLECADGTYYVGSTIDLQRRLWQHQNGEGAAYTRRRQPVTLLWSAEFARIDDAFAFEKQVPGWNRRKREALIEGRFEDLPGLSSRSWEALRRRTPGQEYRHPGFRDGPGGPPQPPEDASWGSPRRDAN